MGGESNAVRGRNHSSYGRDALHRVRYDTPSLTGSCKSRIGRVLSTCLEPDVPVWLLSRRRWLPCLAMNHEAKQRRLLSLQMQLTRPKIRARYREIDFIRMDACLFRAH
jgi:hypothetical protein